MKKKKRKLNQMKSGVFTRDLVRKDKITTIQIEKKEN